MQEFEVFKQQEVSDYEVSDYQTERGKPMPSKNHSTIEARITGAFDYNYGEQFITRTELSLNLSTGKATPDICLYPLSPMDWLQDEKTVSDPPLMALEILSPTQGMESLTDKMDIYFGAGVKTYWVVVPTFQTIHIITPDRKYVTFTGGIAKDPVLGIELDMGRVFR